MSSFAVTPDRARAASSSTRRSNRPQRSPAPTVPAFEQLDRTHREVLLNLGRLMKLLEQLEAHGVDDAARATAKDVFAFFEGHARQHHADEERLVFPSLLASSDTALVQHVHRLQQDHGWLEEDWLELAPQIEAIANGYNWFDLPMLRHALPVFQALYEEHIGLEESLIYPEAKRLQQALAAGATSREG